MFILCSSLLCLSLWLLIVYKYLFSIYFSFFFIDIIRKQSMVSSKGNSGAQIELFYYSCVVAAYRCLSLSPPLVLYFSHAHPNTLTSSASFLQMLKFVLNFAVSFACFVIMFLLFCCFFILTKNIVDIAARDREHYTYVCYVYIVVRTILLSVCMFLSLSRSWLTT